MRISLSADSRVMDGEYPSMISRGLPMMNLYMYHKYLRIADNLLPVFSIEAHFILYIKFF
jgi:hypothetical protein